MLIVFIPLFLFKVMIKVNIMILKNFVYPNLTSFFFVLSLSPRFSNIWLSAFAWHILHPTFYQLQPMAKTTT